MALFDTIGKKITTTTQNVVRGTKDFTDIARLNSLIAEDEKQIETLYSQIGKLYFESGEYNPETLVGKLCLALVAATERRAKHQSEILSIKGARKCPSCGSDVAMSAVFCGYCGAKLEAVTPKPEVSAEPRRFCSSCGADTTNDTMFCASCGKKIE
jgi:predicted nucleic acid-binding Zn ribbon protein